MKLGQLTFNTIKEDEGLVALSVAQYVQKHDLRGDIFVAEINPELADTASFCEKYNVDLALATNCLVIEARRADKVWYGACLVLAADMADINGIVRRQLDARKISFAPKEIALSLTKMEYGGITPIGLPDSWPILIDEAVAEHEIVVMGGGVRRSKIAVKTSVLSSLPNFTILDIKKK